MKEKLKNPAEFIEKAIKDYINGSPENTLRNPANDKAWAEPIVGFSRGDDPIYESYKEHVGPFHFTPLEIFQLSFPDSKCTAEDLTVISWVLPQTEKTKSDARRESRLPTERWTRARIFGEEVNVKLRQHVVDVLKSAGIEAVAPMLSPLWERKQSERFGFASNWSERHAAHASGLGTFGLCDGLITPVGKAMRCGSVVARIRIPATPRPYQHHREYCLFFTKGTCGKCIKRCPAGAVTKEGHNKMKCMAYIRSQTQYIASTFGFEGYGCGSCQTDVPCESRIPIAKNK